MIWPNTLVTCCSLFVFVAAIRHYKLRIQTDAFFLFVYASSLIYLEIAPLLALVSNELPEAANRHFLPPQHYEFEYLLLQLATVAGLHLPMLAIFCTKRKTRQQGTFVINPTSSTIVGLAAAALALGYLVVAIRNSLLDARLGSEAIADVIVSMNPVDYLTFRTYQESALFFIGVMVFIIRNSQGLTKQVNVILASIHISVYALYALLNSRISLLLLIVSLVGWWMVSGGRVLRRYFRWVFAASVFGAYLLTVAINIREQDTRELRATSFVPGFTIFDSQGVNRLDCIDLMARLQGRMEVDGPAWGAAWESSTWLVRRLWDPEGFDLVRRSLQTTAKRMLMSRYLDWSPSDYPSCCMTDLFGNFMWLGFPIAAITFGLALRSAVAATTHPVTASGVLIGVFAISNCLSFERPMDSILFGWVRVLPALAFTMMMRPFVVCVPTPNSRASHHARECPASR